MTNEQILEQLFKEEKIRLRRGRIFDTHPQKPRSNADPDRVEGMMLGLAVGDALGNRSESMTPDRRFQKFGEIRDYLPNPYAEFDRVGLPSDDTQLAFWTLEQMIEDEGFIPENVARRFCRDRIFGLGSSVREFLYNFRSGRPWFESGPRSAGNGALMRIAPVLIPHLKTADEDLWTDTALCAMTTHNDSASITSCLAFVKMLWQLLEMEEPPAPEWWPETFVKTARDLEIDDSYRLRGGRFIGYRGNLSDFVGERVADAFQRDLPTVTACNSWYSGAYLLETVPSVIYILMKHGNDPEEAIVRAVNDTRDNDTIGAIVGAAIGALHGKNKLPGRWKENLLGRTSADDDGRIFEILEEAGKIWWN
jgi:ADP-ribosylglycohydrolase